MSRAETAARCAAKAGQNGGAEAGDDCELTVHPANHPPTKQAIRLFMDLFLSRVAVGVLSS
jgi:hypothetical protein